MEEYINNSEKRYYISNTKGLLVGVQACHREVCGLKLVKTVGHFSMTKEPIAFTIEEAQLIYAILVGEIMVVSKDRLAHHFEYYGMKSVFYILTQDDRYVTENSFNGQDPMLARLFETEEEAEDFRSEHELLWSYSIDQVEIKLVSHKTE